ncbi:MAG: type II toxin-antitoxin system prevent-host-death family antitoxin [Anaerolineae bacterium]|nr:type II toxin-antitoxin system prevent-host-death family antitoxin [Anaerolineae bacterium]MDW8101067.1 type II toxin-antitoxin system prevent-host-death family antitoxin [Anaerolineae bacterium]
MSNVGAYQARIHFAELLKRVQRGERIYITHHGVTVAVLAPPEPVSARSLSEVIAALKEFRRGRSAGVPLKKLIDEGRM